MDSTLTIILAVIIGVAIGWIAKSIFAMRVKRTLNSVNGFLESEKLMKEKFQKENHALQQIHATREAELRDMIKRMETHMKQMDEDLILLQMDNEKTEELMKATQPEIYALKTKLIEANNTISRYKAMIQSK